MSYAETFRRLLHLGEVGLPDLLSVVQDRHLRAVNNQAGTLGKRKQSLQGTGDYKAFKKFGSWRTH